ncbi:MAG: hypothetical protein V1808_05025 [Candidatus Daviesbacteria bacterium]
MGSFGGYYKGEKKKKKQSGGMGSGSFAPVFTPPTVIGKGKLREK